MATPKEMFPEAYEEGKAFFRKHLGATKRMMADNTNPYWRVKDNGNGRVVPDHLPPCDAFSQGMREAEEEYIQSECGVAEFLRKLADLCVSSGVEVSSGCGCCGAGGYVKDLNGDTWEFSINPVENN